MENKPTADYRPPEDFNPYLWVDAIKGLSETIEWFITEGPATESPLPDGALHSLQGLAWAQQRFANELHDYLYAIENVTTLKLPRDAEDFEKYGIRKNRDGSVRESAALYSIR